MKVQTSTLVIFLLFLPSSNALATSYNPGTIGLDIGGHIDFNFTRMWKGDEPDGYGDKNPYGDIVFGFGPDIRFRPFNWLFGVDIFYNYGFYKNDDPYYWPSDKTTYHDIMIGCAFSYYPHNVLGFSILGGYAWSKMSIRFKYGYQPDEIINLSGNGFYVGGEGEILILDHLSSVVSLRYAPTTKKAEELEAFDYDLGGFFLSFCARTHL